MPTQELEFVHIPERIIKNIKNAQNLGEFYFDGIKEYHKEVLKANTLICEPNGIFKWFIPNSKELIIYVNKLIMKEPNDIGKICKLDFISMYGEGAHSAHDGENTSDINAEDKPTQPEGSGLVGQNAAHGKEGREGKSFDMPTLYIFYNELILIDAIGGINSGLMINGNGIKGGNGGQGGKGGNGGQGARGKDGSSSGFGLICDAGPGVGASGGNAGSGGKGGKAGKGGDGLNVYLLGPKNESDFFKINQLGALQGNPGSVGYDGIPGKKGTFGTKPSACPTYPYVSSSFWHDGELIPNPNKIIGDKNVDGKDGLTYYSDNYTQFFVLLEIPPLNFNENDIIKGKYITPSDLTKSDGFKKLIPFDFEETMLELKDFYNFRNLPSEQRETFENFKYKLEYISKNIIEQGLNKDDAKFNLSIQRVLPIGEKFYNHNFFKIIAELDLGNEVIREEFESFYTIIDEKKLTISNFLKFQFNSEYYNIEKNIIGHRIEKFLTEKLKY